MSVTQVAFEIPPAIQRGIDEGTFIRYGGVVRDQAGHIVKHLQEVPVAESNESVLKQVAKFAKKNKNVLIIGAVVTSVIGGIVYVIYKNRRGEEVKIPKCVADFDSSLMRYIDAIRRGKVTEDHIDNVLSALHEIKKHQTKVNQDGNFSFENAELLLDIIREYTIKLAEANDFDMLDKLEVNNDNIIDLQNYLTIQKNIFEKSA